MIKEDLVKYQAIIEELGEDDSDLEDIVNDEIEPREKLEWVMRKYREHIASANQAKELKDLYAKQQKKFEQWADKVKDLGRIYYDMSRSKGAFKGVSGTFSIRHNPPKPVVIDFDRLPTEFVKYNPAADKQTINFHYKETGELPEGCQLDNGSESIIIR